MRITSKGQITIPQELRDRLGFLPDTEVEFEVQGDKLVLTKGRSLHRRSRDLINRMAGKATVHLTTDQIMQFTRLDDSDDDINRQY